MFLEEEKEFFEQLNLFRCKLCQKKIQDGYPFKDDRKELHLKKEHPKEFIKFSEIRRKRREDDRIQDNLEDLGYT